MPYIIGGVAAIVCAVLGFVFGSAYRRRSAEATIGSAEDEARRILNDAMKNAESKKKEALLEAKDEIHQLRQETEKDLRERRSEVQRQEHRLQQKEETLDRKIDNLEVKEEKLAEKARDIDLKLEDFEKISDETPVLVNVKPHGTGTVGTDFHDAGGVASLMKVLEKSLHTECLTVTGKSVGENLKDADMPYNTEIIRPLDNPLDEKGGISILFGNLAPKGAVIKRSAASKHLLKHRGPAKVFEDLEECQKYLLDENSDMTKDTVIVLRGFGPVGAPGMPENGNYMPLPPKLNREGVKDFVRITDSRMSGGCFGTQILHVAPESAIGGPLAAVRDGDIIHLDVDNNLIELEVSDEEIEKRLEKFKPQTHDDIKRGFVRNFIDNVTQADEGCDLTYMQYKE